MTLIRAYAHVSHYDVTSRRTKLQRDLDEAAAVGSRHADQVKGDDDSLVGDTDKTRLINSLSSSNDSSHHFGHSRMIKFQQRSSLKLSFISLTVYVCTHIESSKATAVVNVIQNSPSNIIIPNVMRYVYASVRMCVCVFTYSLDVCALLSSVTFVCVIVSESCE